MVVRGGAWRGGQTCVVDMHGKSMGHIAVSVPAVAGRWKWGWFGEGSGGGTAAVVAHGGWVDGMGSVLA